MEKPFRTKILLQNWRAAGKFLKIGDLMYSYIVWAISMELLKSDMHIWVVNNCLDNDTSVKPDLSIRQNGK